MRRRAARIDSNQPEIVEAFRAMGATVFPTHTVGRGFPDLVCLVSGVVLLVEIKDGSKPPSARKLTSDEADFHHTWPVEIVESSGDVETLVNQIRSGRKAA